MIYIFIQGSPLEPENNKTGLYMRGTTIIPNLHLSGTRHIFDILFFWMQEKNYNFDTKKYACYKDTQ